jgi:predicted RNase H-like nuclease
VQGAKLHGATFSPELPRVYETFLEVLSERPSFSNLVVNAPVGYLELPEMGPRTCDIQARSIAGARGVTIRNAPSRAVINGEIAWSDAGIDAVTATLLPRYREVAREMSPFRQRLVYEGNPELSFYQLNQDTSMHSSKKIEEGKEERRDVLESHIPGIDKVLEIEIDDVSQSHIYDALSLLWTARRVYGHAARRIPIEPEWDSEGLRMEIVY